MLSSDGPTFVKLEEQWLLQAEVIYEQTKDLKRETQRFDAATDKLGWVGERAFKEYLTAYHPRLTNHITWLNEHAEQFGPYDFDIAGVTVDVKCARLSTPKEKVLSCLSHWEYLYPVTQAPLAKDQIVLVYLWPSSLDALIVGSIAGKAVARLPQRNKSVQNAQQRFVIPNYVIRTIAQHFNDIATFLDTVAA